MQYTINETQVLSSRWYIYWECHICQNECHTGFYNDLSL